MIDTDALRKKVIDLAIHGKLVERRAEEGTAEELYKQIQSEKAKLIKEGKIKKEKPLPAISEKEIPFDIPESWKWIYLGEIFDHNAGKALNNADKEGTLLEYITTSNLYWDHFELDELKSMFFKDSEIEKCTIRKGDLLICEGGDIGRSAIWNFDYEMRIQNHIHKLRGYGGIEPKYYYYIMRNYKDRGLIDGHGIGLQGFSSNKVHFLVVPLPPLAEQRRIVAKIDEILSQIEIIDTLQTRYVKDVASLKSKILDAAIRGKLVEQRAEEGTAEELYKQIQSEKAKLINEGKIKKEKPLPAISEKEIPFDIPESWKWVKFGQIMINRDSERIPLSVSEREKLEKIYDYYGASGVIDKVDRYLFNEKLLLIGEDGANLLSRSTPIAFLAEGKYWVNNHAHVIDCNKELVHIEYIMYHINAISLAPYVTGTAQPKMNQEKMNSILIALPPYAEQRRIVAKIEELLPLCERLAE